MPAESEKQRIMMALAAHQPGQLYKKNRGVLGMDKEKLREFSRKPVLGER